MTTDTQGPENTRKDHGDLSPRKEACLSAQLYLGALFHTVSLSGNEEELGVDSGE